MLSNALNLLLHWVINRQTEHPDAPVFLLHPFAGEPYQIIVQRVPKQETLAA